MPALVALLAVGAITPSLAAPLGIVDGYKNAKWGMSVVQVKAALQLQVENEYDGRGPEENDTHCVVFSTSDYRSVHCWFWKDQLFQVEYAPNLSDGDRTGATTVEQLLQEKYGPGTSLKNLVDPLGIPLRVTRWANSVTQIDYQMYDPDATRRLGISNQYPSSTVSVLYTSKNLDALRSAANLAREKAEEEAQKAEARSRKSDL